MILCISVKGNTYICPLNFSAMKIIAAIFRPRF